MKIIAIDPGSRYMGYAVFNNENGNFDLIDYGTMTINPRYTKTQKLHSQYTRLSKYISETEPSIMVIENPILGFHGNVKSLSSLAQAVGVILSVAGKHELEVVDYANTTIKKNVTGNSRAEKFEVKDAVLKIYKKVEYKQRYDTFDAIAIGLCWWVENAR